jgi:PAS fold
MSSPAVTRLFDEIPTQSLNSEAAVCFLLDDQLRLIYCNPAWERYAIANGAPHLMGVQVVGRCILDSIAGELAGYYESLYRRALSTGEVQEQVFHCSSATLERLMVMRVHRLRSASALLAVCSTRVERAHSRISSPVLQSLYRNSDSVIVMCSNCRRTRRACEPTARWDWVPDFVEHRPPMVSHGLCGLCLEYYRWELRRGSSTGDERSGAPRTDFRL